MKRVAVAATVVGACLGVALFWAASVANPDASCADDPNPLRLFPPTADIACVPTLWDEWHGRTVVVAGGPYEGRSGVVQAVSGDHVKVAFPPGTDGLWFREGQLVKEAPGAE